MYCEIIHELLIHQGETEHNILYNVLWDYTWTINLTVHWYRMFRVRLSLYNVLWDYTWTINTSGRDRTQHSI